ncbi:MAG: imidazolonepropionase [Pseudomonadota bacterium]
MTADILFHSVSLLMTGVAGPPLRDGAVAFTAGQVVFVGPSGAAPAARETVDCAGLVGLPGLVDCHTHTLFAGSRALEFSRRLAGATYTEILEAGGGILSTVAATRAASDEALRAVLGRRLDAMLALGVTTVEVKSGYGLDPDTEERMLRIAGSAPSAVEVLPTFLGAHAVPVEHRGQREAYVAQVIHEQLPRCAPHARFIDVYCDRGAFTLEEARAILVAGRARGLLPRVHAEQVAWTGAAALAASLGATSADHLEHLDEAGIAAMAEAGTVAVLLPGAQLYLRDPAPPVEALRRAGVPMAVATDFNPGSSPVRDLWCCATLACLRMGLTVEEALLGITRHAGRALGRSDLGWLGPGSAADLALLAPPPGEPPELSVLVQYLGGHRATHVVKRGRWVLRDGRMAAAGAAG